VLTKARRDSGSGTEDGRGVVADNRSFETMTAAMMDDPRKWDVARQKRPQHPAGTARKTPKFEGVSEYEAQFVEHDLEGGGCGFEGFEVEAEGPGDSSQAMPSARGPRGFEGQSSYATDYKEWPLPSAKPAKPSAPLCRRPGGHGGRRDW
jgi:hypothetical protein